MNFVVLEDMALSNIDGHNLIIERYVQHSRGTPRELYEHKFAKMDDKCDVMQYLLVP